MSYNSNGELLKGRCFSMKEFYVPGRIEIVPIAYSTFKDEAIPEQLGESNPMHDT